VEWEIVESVSNSLKVSGYEPSDDESLPVTVSVMASETAEGVVLEVRVTENGEQASRLSAVFPRGSRLEKDARGRLKLLTALPPRSDSRGSIKPGSDDYLTTDQLFVFFRRAIGTEVEAQESRVRIAATPQSVKRTDGDGEPAEPVREGSDVACNGRLEKRVSKDVRSHSGTTRSWPLAELRFAGNESQLPMTYVNGVDSIECSPQAIWIVHSVPIEPQFTIKRFSGEGKLERLIEGVLPVVASDRIFGRIDARSLREENGAVWFDRIEVKLETGGGHKLTIEARETFMVQVPLR
jgi:hypothetical protein